MRKYLNCCGLDVHKDTVFCCINKNGKTFEVKEFSTLTADIVRMSEWMKEHGVKKIAMESTGIYWVPLWNILEKESFCLILVNPYMIKQMPGRKSDVKDSEWIAQLLAKDMLRGSLIAREKIRELRMYSREYVRKQGRITSIVQGMERILESANIRITSMVSKIESKSVFKIIDSIIEGETDAGKLIKHVHGRILRGKKEKVLHSLEGFIKPEHVFILRQKKQEYELITNQALELETEMGKLCDAHYKEQMDLLKTMPGVDKQAAMQLIAESGADMSAFESSSKFTGWAGLRPRNDESAGKIKSKAITKGNTYLRRIIVQIAWAASRTKGSHYQAKFIQLAIRKGNKKALIAIARKLLTVMWNMLSKKQPYNPQLQPVFSVEQLQKKKQYLLKEIERLNKYN